MSGKSQTKFFTLPKSPMNQWQESITLNWGANVWVEATKALVPLPVERAADDHSRSLGSANANDGFSQ